MGSTRIVEQCQVAPSSGAPTELLLPLLHSDMIFFSTNFLEILFFYSVPSCSESHFSHTIVPNLKKSLSLTLKHFTPLAGKIIFPLTTGMPLSQYIAGDSISMAIAVSDADFNHLTGNLPREADQFHDFVPRLPPATYFPDFIKFSVAAVQVTQFPNHGFCIGLTVHHSIGDGSTVIRFLAAWSSITKRSGDDAHTSDLSFHDRSGVQDADALATTCWGYLKHQRPNVSSVNTVPTHKVRATFVLSGAQIRNLIQFVANKNPSLVGHVSPFAIVCALTWTSFARSAAGAGEEVADDEPEYFNCAADFRARLNPPLPDNYFGNCLAPVLAESTHARLKGDRGIVFAAEAIGEAIRKTVNNENGILDGTMSRLLELQHVQLNGSRMLGVAGSPTFDVYARDFGWGRPKKFEPVQIDSTIGFVFLTESREFQGGVEIALSVPKIKMDVFAAVFDQGLREATIDAYNQLSKL